MSDFFDNDEPMNEPIAEVVKAAKCECGELKVATSPHPSLLRLEIGQYQFLEFDVNAMSIDEAKVMINKAKELDNFKNGKAANVPPVQVNQKQPVTVQQAAPKPTPAPVQRSTATSGAKLEWFKVPFDEEVTLTIIEDKGEFETKFGKNHGFVVEIEGFNYKLGTMSKALLPRFIPGETVTIKKYRDGSMTKYEVS